MPGGPGRCRRRNLWDEVADRGNLKSLKQTMKMDVLKCMTVDGVLKESTMYALAYNLVRVTMCQAVAVRVSERIGLASSKRQAVAHPEEGEEMPELVVNPRRPGRQTNGGPGSGVPSSTQ